MTAHPISLAGLARRSGSGSLGPLLASSLVALALGAEIAAQECSTGPITEVSIDNQSIFDTDAMDEDRSFRWAYDLANDLHVETQASFIRNELLFREGDCFDPLLLEESERILRNYEFIARASVEPILRPDGSYRAAVETQDEWTTKMTVGLAFEEGLRLEGIELTEENLAGQGILTSLFFRQRREVRDIGMTVRLPRLFATRTNGELSLGRTRTGDFFSESLFYPFVGEVGRAAGRQAFSRRETLFPYSSESADGRDNTQIFLPFTREVVRATVAARLGEPGNLTVFGIGVLRESLSFDDFPLSLEAAPDGDFSAREPASPTQAAEVSGQVEPLAIFRLNFLLGQRNVRFIERRGLDALTGIQDLRVGTEISATLGRAIGDVGGGLREAPDDLYLRLFGFGGWAPADWVVQTSLNAEGRIVFSDGVQTSLNAEGRIVFSDGADPTSVHDLLAEWDLYAYRLASGDDRHTLFVRLSGAGGWSVERPFQLTLGGRTGVRGYRERAFPGGRRVVATVEDRIFVRWPAPELIDLGFTAFTDVGRIWDGDVPFGRTTSWQASVGGGIRLGFPTGTRGVLRADLALPVTGPRAWSSPVFRVSLQEVIGAVRGFADEEITRSRRPAVGTDLLTGEVR